MRWRTAMPGGRRRWWSRTGAGPGRGRWRVRVSAMSSTSTASQLLSASLSLLPSPTRSSQRICRARTAKIGSRRGRVEGAPAARMTSCPLSAGWVLPETGASTNATPCRAARWASRSVHSTPTVLIWTQTASGPNADRAPLRAGHHVFDGGTVGEQRVQLPRRTAERSARPVPRRGAWAPGRTASDHWH